MKQSTTRREARVLSLIVLALAGAVVTLSIAITTRPAAIPESADLSQLAIRLENLEKTIRDVPRAVSPSVTVSGQKQLLFYNRPPKTGSTSIRIAMKEALNRNGLTSAHCFNMIEWNEMAIKTIVNRRDVDFYGCHTRLTNARHAQLSQMRGGNVTFMSSTRDPENLILSAYMQAERDRKIQDITDDDMIAKEVEKYKAYVDKYPIDALYRYHGADVPLKHCPVQYIHEDAMRRVAERYEIVVDITRPEESAVMVEAVTGLKPNFNQHFNARTTDTSGKMLQALKKVDTSHKTCGNELVHNVLQVQFNMIKDRLLQNRCFTEETGDFKLCDQAVLKMENMKERSRNESFDQRFELLKLVKKESN